jgi:hypothetical protein
MTKPQLVKAIDKANRSKTAQSLRKDSRRG